MKTKQTIGLIVAVVLFIVTGVASVITNTVSESIFDKVTEEVLSEGVTFAYSSSPATHCTALRNTDIPLP